MNLPTIGQRVTRKPEANTTDWPAPAGTITAIDLTVITLTTDAGETVQLARCRNPGKDSFIRAYRPATGSDWTN